MKNLFIIISFLFSVFFAGCGSNSKVDGTEDTELSSVVSLNSQEIIQDASGVNFTLALPFVKEVSDAYEVELSAYLLEVMGCTVQSISYTPANSLTLSGGEGSTETLYVTGAFDTNCTPTGYTFTATQEITQGTQSDTRQVSFVVDYNDPDGGSLLPPPVEDGYSFYNATTPLDISEANTQYEIRVQLLKDGYVAVGETIILNVFDATYGHVADYQAITETDGYATFIYTSPVTLPADGSSATLTADYFIDENNTISKDLVLSFNSAATTPIEDTTLPIVVIPSDQKVVTLDSNSKIVQLSLAVYKNISPYTQGSVKVELPAKVLDGADVGQFDSYEVAVNEQGIAVFTYTGPSNLQALITSGDTGSVFNFYHTENSTERAAWTVEYELPEDLYISRNYELDIITTDDDFSMGIPDQEKNFNVVLSAKDASGNDVPLESESITNITVTTTNATIGQLLDTGTNTLVDTLSLNTINNSPFILVSKDKSGLVPLEVVMTFNDLNGDEQTLSTIINVRVLSGPPSAISISYVSTGQDQDRAKYIEKLAISVTDEYGNKVNTQPNIALGAIVGYAVDGSESSSIETNETKRLFYGKSEIDAGTASGTILNLGDGDPATTDFEDTTAGKENVFRYVNLEGDNSDKLVIFGAGKNYESMGKWDMALGGDNHTLTLQDEYYGEDRYDLYYAVGHNYYQDLCREDGREWIGSTDSATYQLDEEGTVIVDYKYDYHLTGKDAMIWVNLDGYQPDTGEQLRIGEVTKHTLRGAGLRSLPSDGYVVKAGTSVYATFVIEHENAPEWYRNAHFGYAIQSGSTCSYSVVATSNWFDARTCDNTVSVDIDNNVSTSPVEFGRYDGTSYITFNLTAPFLDCTFNITDLRVADEF